MASQDYRLEPHPEFGFRRIVPTPAPDEITRYYAEEFYSSGYGFNNSAPDVQERDRAFNEGHRDDISAAIEEVLGTSLVGTSLLDVGCGWAQALVDFRRRGVVCFGFDPAPEAVAHARELGLEVRQAGLDRMDMFGRRFDIVTLLHVLEHLADPVATLTEIHQSVIRSGGCLVVEVPNEFNMFQVAGREVHGLNEWWVAPPAHLNYFDRGTLDALLHGTGFELQIAEATFPMEMFLLQGENYVKERDVGALCHKRRVAFELNLRSLGRAGTLRRFYRALAAEGLGRTLVAVAVAR